MAQEPSGFSGVIHEGGRIGMTIPMQYYNAHMKNLPCGTIKVRGPDDFQSEIGIFTYAEHAMLFFSWQHVYDRYRLKLGDKLDFKMDDDNVLGFNISRAATKVPSANSATPIEKSVSFDALMASTEVLVCEEDGEEVDCPTKRPCMARASIPQEMELFPTGKYRLTLANAGVGPSSSVRLPKSDAGIGRGGRIDIALKKFSVAYEKAKECVATGRNFSTVVSPSHIQDRYSLNVPSRFHKDYIPVGKWKVTIRFEDDEPIETTVTKWARDCRFTKGFDALVHKYGLMIGDALHFEVVGSDKFKWMVKIFRAKE